MKNTIIRKLLGKLDLSVFMREYAEKKHLHTKGAYSSSEVDSLLSKRNAFELFQRFPLSPKVYEVIKDGSLLGDPKIHSAGGIDVNYLVDQFNSGASLRVNSIHLLVHSVGDFCAQLTKECWAPVYANLYITPKGRKGFKPHFDSHDVFIMQLHGEKRWSLHESYGNKQNLPVPGLRYDESIYPPGPPTTSLLMQEGDVLYIPRGHMHSAETDADHLSIHVTFSINWISWSELIFDVMAQATHGNRGLRESVLCSMLREFGSDYKGEVDRAFIFRLIGEAINDVDPSLSIKNMVLDLDGNFQKRGNFDLDA